MRGGTDEGETSKKPVANFHHHPSLQLLPPPPSPPWRTHPPPCPHLSKVQLPIEPRSHHQHHVGFGQGQRPEMREEGGGRET